MALLEGFSRNIPIKPTTKLRYADVAVTATASEFGGFYRNKKYHEPDMHAVLDRALAAGVEKVMLTGMSAPDVPINLAIARKRPHQCSITVGVHPYHAAEADNAGEVYFQNLAVTIRNIVREEPGILGAFGELGLDYDHLARAPKEAQIRTFVRQLDLIVAEQWQLPLFLHCRAAFDDFVRILQPYLARLSRRGLVHSFVGTTQQMQVLTEMGLDVSVNGFSFRDRESLEMVRDIPMNRLQIETDSPWGEIQPSAEVAKAYLANATALPASKKKDKFEMGAMVKTRNESCTIERVALIVAGLKGLCVEEVAENAYANSVRMFWSS